MTFAPTAPKETSSWLAAAPVLSMKSRAVSVTNVEMLISSVSILILKASTLPAVKVSSRRSASSLSVPSALRSSAVRRSVIVALIGLPGKNFAPPEAKKIVPLNGCGALAEVDAEVLDADAQVDELEDAVEADRARRDERVRVRRRGAFGFTGWPPYFSCASPSEKPVSRTTRPGLPLEGRIEPVTPKRGNVIVASCSASSCWPFGAFGS